MENIRKGTKCSVYNIDWDTDEETIKANNLPIEIELIFGEDFCCGIQEGGCLDREDVYFAISEYLSDEYGFCHDGFNCYFD